MSSQTTTKLTNTLTVIGAAEDGDAVAVARLLAAGAAVDERPAHGGETPLMRAAARGHETVVHVLLDAGADACARRADGFTPLILAVFFGHEAVVRLLVERGADASARTGLGTTAARWAEARGFASMAGVLREAEASRPRAAVAHEVEKEAVARAKAATTIASGEVEIFSKGRGRMDAVREESADESPSPARAAKGDVDSSNVTAAGVSVRRSGQLPAHPTTSTFSVGHFLRSWQGSLGALLLLAAVGVGVFAFVQRNNAPRNVAQPTPTPMPAAPQAAQQAPVSQLPTPEPSPAFPAPDAQGVVPVTDQGYPVPNASGQPYYITTSPVAPVASDAPRELTVVSESGATSAQDTGQSGRRNGASDSSATSRSDARNDNASDPPRAARTPEPEPQRPAPAAPQNQTPPPPAPQPTPGRAKVIQWPPQ